MAQQSYAPISRVDIERLYVDPIPGSWRGLEERTVHALENREISDRQSQVIVTVLRTLENQGIPVPPDADDLYQLMRPLIEAVPGAYA